MAKDKNKNDKRLGTRPKTQDRNLNDIHLIGDNILYNNGISTAYYIIPLQNYSTADDAGITYNIEQLYHIAESIASVDPEATFTISKLHKVIKAVDVKNNLVEGIRMYSNDYEMPESFTEHIEDDIQVYCLLGIVLNLTNTTDVSESSIGQIIKQTVASLVSRVTLSSKADPERLITAEKPFYTSLKTYNVVRAAKDLIFYEFMSRVYPSYDISYEKLSYINESTYESIMGAIHQTVSDNFDWFELENQGMAFFDTDDYEKTYGCMLYVHTFPEYIIQSNFDFESEIGAAEDVHIYTTLKCYKKDEIKGKLKRQRASDRYERDQALEAGAELEQIEKAQTSVDLCTAALSQLEDDGELFCQFNTSILVIAETKEELKSRVTQIINIGKDHKILLSKSLNQALDYVNNYIHNKPTKYPHMCSARFPLSFQLNKGATVGDLLTDFKRDEQHFRWSPSIGTSIV